MGTSSKSSSNNTVSGVPKPSTYRSLRSNTTLSPTYASVVYSPTSPTYASVVMEDTPSYNTRSRIGSLKDGNTTNPTLLSLRPKRNAKEKRSLNSNPE